MLLGVALGIDWDKVRASMEDAAPARTLAALPPPTGLSIAELSKQITPPRHISETLAASVEALRKLGPPPPA